MSLILKHKLLKPIGLLSLLTAMLAASCQPSGKKQEEDTQASVSQEIKTNATPTATAQDTMSCHKVPNRFATVSDPHTDIKEGAGTTAGMIWIKGGSFAMGADNDQARKDEYPKHQVTVDGFWMDATEVTNAQFSEFVKSHGLHYYG